MERRFERGNDIVFDKAWNANKNLFQYKAYNMDPNNETPLECVPNALFKMYGDKSKGTKYYNGKIANGGMDYIKKMLDIGGESAYLDCIDDNEPKLIEGKKGYSPMDILNFCNDHKIRCFGYDWMMTQFITNKDINIDFHSNLPAFVFYFNDHHIYLINDKDVRHALLNCNKTVDVTALAKEKKQKLFTKDLLIDIPKEEWINHTKTNIYITDTRVVHNTFYKLACAGDVYNVGIKMSEKEGITRFKYENGNMIIFNPDIKAVIQTIQILNHDLDVEVADDEDISKNKNIFKNQRIHTLAREYLDKEFGGVPSSTFNTTGDYIFHSDFIKSHAFVGWFDEPKSLSRI